MSTPVRSAANDTKAGAPEKTSLPPTTSKRPKSPLCAVAVRAFFTRKTSPGPANFSSSRGNPMSRTTKSPTYFLALRSPVFGLWKVTVTSAFTALPKTSPLSESIPVGTSTAILSASKALICSTICVMGGLSFPLVPVPSNASTTTSAIISGMAELSVTSQTGMLSRNG